MTIERIEPFFLEGSSGRLFVMVLGGKDNERCVMFIPPFGEELNRCRRQMIETARRLVSGGSTVIIPDLYGTGDSAGEFYDASWGGWVDDLCQVAKWAQSESYRVDALVAIRLGCILAAQTVKELDLRVRKTVFWQPVYTGPEYLRQFLRLRIAAGMGTGAHETVDELEARLASGETVEVAGYALTPALYASIGELELDAMVCEELGLLRVFEVKRNPTGRSPARNSMGSRGLKAQVADMGVKRYIRGEPFWVSAEVVTNPELTELTVEYLKGRGDGSI